MTGNDEITQPVKIYSPDPRSEDASAQVSASPEEVTAAADLPEESSSESNTEIPDWLLKFAQQGEPTLKREKKSEDTQPVQVNQADYPEMTGKVDFQQTVEAEDQHVSVQMESEQNSWKAEDFQSAQSMASDDDIAAVNEQPVASEITIPATDGDAGKQPQTNPAIEVMGSAEIAPADLPQVSSASNSDARISKLKEYLRQNQITETIDLIREYKTESAFRQEAIQSLRSYLTLEADKKPLWDLYEELTLP